MGSTGEPERKRRHFSSISPTAAAATKKSLPFPSSEDKKLDAAVLQYQNQKLVQQLEAQKVEYLSLENKFHQRKEKQKTHDDTLLVVNNSWERLIDDLESVSISTRGSSNDGYQTRHSQTLEDAASCTTMDNFMCRLLETGATESCSGNMSSSEREDDILTTQATTKNTLQNIISSINGLWHGNDELSNALRESLPEDESIRQLQKTSSVLQTEVKSLRLALGNLHLKHRSFGNEILGHRDTDAKYKAEHKRLAGELESTMAELEESFGKLAALKAQKDAGQGTPFLFPTLGNTTIGDNASDKQKDLQDMESALKESMDVASSRLQEIRSLHERRIEIMRKLSDLQNTLMDLKHVSSSKRFLLTADQVGKSKAEMDQLQASWEKLQVEKDNFVWREREVNVKVDLSDISRRFSMVSESRISEVEKLLHKQGDERVLIKSKFEEASREPGRKGIIEEFKALVSSLPKDMEIMQSQLNEHKENASEIHSVRAEVRSLANILERKVNELETLSRRSASQISEMHKLQAVIHDLRESDQELKLILEMFKRESTDSRDVMEYRDLEYRAWAHVQSLKSSLDEHSLEQRVKAANEAEAISQQRLATAEAEIADLRQKLEVSVRDICKLSEVLKFKREEGEAYLSEIESIGQAYEDMQTQNQQLLQQITERDDYNIKFVMESVKARQLQEALRMEIHTMDKEIQQASASLDFFSLKVGRLEEQLRIWSEQVGKLVEDGLQSSVALQNTNRRLSDVQGDSQQLKESLDERQSKVKICRLNVSELQIELEKQRFNKKRIEEDLEVVARKATRLRSHTEGSSVLEKLRQELKEYKAILKCGICQDRQKEVVISKCYHLFCNPCVQRTLESRHRKCPTCATSFGPNDVKPIYI